MIRTVLKDHQWEAIEPHCLGKPGDPGRSGTDNRLFMEAVLYKARTNCPWHDLPAEFGKWNTIFVRFNDWSKAGVFEAIFEAVSDDPDMEYVMIDGTVVPVHRHGHGAKGGLSQAIGKSKGGWTTKIVALTDALGNLVRFQLLPGNRYDTLGVAPLIEGVSFDAMTADKAFDSNWIIEELNARGAQIVISQRPQRKAQLEIDKEIYKWRHLIENFFAKLKDFKAIALRCEKTDRNFAAMIYACAPVINSR